MKPGIRAAAFAPTNCNAPYGDCMHDALRESRMRNSNGTPPVAHKKRPAHVQAFVRSTDHAQNDATIEPLNCFLMNSFTSGDWYALTSFFTHG